MRERWLRLRRPRGARIRLRLLAGTLNFLSFVNARQARCFKVRHASADIFGLCALNAPGQAVGLAAMVNQHKIAPIAAGERPALLLDGGGERPPAIGAIPDFGELRFRFGWAQTATFGLL